MPTNDHLQSKLVRILRAETADHPGLDQAVQAADAELGRVVWSTDHRPDRMGADRLANHIEDWLGHRGEPLPMEVTEGWRETCRWALHKARSECFR